MVTLYFPFSGLFCFLSVSYIMYCLTHSHPVIHSVLSCCMHIPMCTIKYSAILGSDSSVGTRHLWV